MTTTFEIKSSPFLSCATRSVAERFERAVRTLARPAMVREGDGGSTPTQRTAARFVLLEMMAFDELSDPDDRKYVYGAFEHAFRHDDVAPSLLGAIKRDYRPLDYSAEDFSTPVSRAAQAAAVAAASAKRAEAERKREARRQRDQAARARMKGAGGSGRQGGKGK